LRRSSAWRRFWGAVYNVSPLTRSSAAFDHYPRAVHDLDTKSLGALRWKDLDTVALLEKSL
jgi:hypothetical protein